MVFRFLILSDEVDNFKREIQIDPDASFLDLHNAILKSVNYKEGDMSSFFICSDNWEKDKEITLVEMDTSSEEDAYVMEDCILNDFLEDEKQKIMYVFDYMTERAFFIELREIITGKHIDKPVCTISEGEAPEQYIEIENFEVKATTTVSGNVDTDESFYGDESYDLEELDSEGFEGLDENGEASEPSNDEL